MAEEQLLESYQLNQKQTLALANLLPTYLKLKKYDKAAAFGQLAYEALPNDEYVAFNYAGALLQEKK